MTKFINGKPAVRTSAPTADTNPVELVAGPLCGLVIGWPEKFEAMLLEYPAGHALYQRESPTTAVYLGDRET